MKNKIAWFTIGLAVMLCIAATTPIDRLRLTSDADGGNHSVTNVNTFNTTTVNASALNVTGSIVLTNGSINYLGGVTTITNLFGPYRAGTTNIGNLATSLLVTFTTALPDANYAVGITFDTSLGAAVSAAATSKTVDGFTISLSAGIAGGASLDYIAWSYR